MSEPRLEKLPEGTQVGDLLTLTKFGLVKTQPSDSADFRLFVWRESDVAEALVAVVNATPEELEALCGTLRKILRIPVKVTSLEELKASHGTELERLEPLS